LTIGGVFKLYHRERDAVYPNHHIWTTRLTGARHLVDYPALVRDHELVALWILKVEQPHPVPTDPAFFTGEFHFDPLAEHAVKVEVVLLQRGGVTAHDTTHGVLHSFRRHVP